LRHSFERQRDRGCLISLVKAIRVRVLKVSPTP
jgi:hypothetical protein